MKLDELSTPKPSAQMARTFESYFGGNIELSKLSRHQARNMLQRVRGVLGEHRQTSKFHNSEKNPSYLKLVMLENVLRSKLKEIDSPSTSLTSPTSSATGPDSNLDDVVKGATKAAGAVGAQSKGQQLGQALDSVSQGKSLNPGQKATMAKLGQGLKNVVADPANANKLQQMLKTTGAAAFENRRRKGRTLRESEVQQAQVVLAAQDMVDRVQKMLEDVTEMQFKELPALADQIKNQIGVEQSAQFNTDATNALQGLVQSVQASKQQLENALGVITGQAPTVPGVDPNAPVAGELPPIDDADVDLDVDADLDIDDTEAPPEVSLGRTRR